MPYHKDLSLWPGPPSSEKLLAVGFLEEGQTYSTGDVSEQFFARLVELLVNPWQPFASAGRQPCGWCRFTGGPGQVHFGEHVAPIGGSLLFVPGASAAYVAPSLIAHYIDAHGYKPPDEFQQAVMTCPRMKSLEYLRGLRAHGVNR
jgi:hypothetical protein